MFTIDTELHLRGHRASTWRNNAIILKEKGLPITPETIVRSASEFDFAYENDTREFDYSGGTEEGRRRNIEGKTNHAQAILTAHPLELVRVDGGKDSTCRSCMKHGPKHCDVPFVDDYAVTIALIRLAKDRGHNVEETHKRHPLNPSRIELVAKIPAGVIQEFVFNV